MSPARHETDPFAILGVGRDATLEEIVEAYRRKRFEATRSDPPKVIQLDAAFMILKDPDQREQITQTLLTKEILGGAPIDDATAPPARPERSAGWTRSPRIKGVVLAILVVVLAVSALIALKPKNAICPQCERSSVTAVDLPGGSVRFYCERPECDFAYTFDAGADAQAEREADGTQTISATE